LIFSVSHASDSARSDGGRRSSTSTVPLSDSSSHASMPSGRGCSVEPRSSGPIGYGRLPTSGSTRPPMRGPVIPRSPKRSRVRAADWLETLACYRRLDEGCRATPAQVWRD
jgi:hypothetical protein